MPIATLLIIPITHGGQPLACVATDAADNALLMALVFWVDLGPTISGRRVDSDLRFMIEKRLAAAGISIPFPQRDLRLSVTDMVPVRVMPASGAGPEAGAEPLPGPR